MKKSITILIAVLINSITWAQTVTVQPKIMVIPYTKLGEDMTQIIENDVNKRIVLAKIREAFDSRGFTTVDLVAKINSLSRAECLSQGSQSDFQSMIIQQSGADIYVEAEIGNDGLALSDQLELWMSEHAYKNNYHIQGTTDKKMIFDDVRIPLKDANGNNYNINKFGLEFLKFARNLGLQITRNTANNTLVITFK